MLALLSLCLSGLTAPKPWLDAAPSDAELPVPYYDVPHDDDQLRGPPSPPRAHLGSPLAARGTPPAPEAAIASLLKYEYEWQAGFIGAGGDVEPPAHATVDEALARCDALVRCRGITYEGNKSTSTAQRIYFKIGDGVEHASGWSAWVKRAGVTPPALTVAVGGASRLELRLRQDFYTVQNLSRAGDAWSFTRPLDDASTLPMCAHLGDITLRLRQPAAKPEWLYFSSMALGAKAMPLPLEVARRAADRAARAGGRGSGSEGRGERGREDGGRRRGSGPRTGQLLAAQNITELLSSSAPHAVLPLTAIRSYERSADGTALVLRFTLTSTSDAVSSAPRETMRPALARAHAYHATMMDLRLTPATDAPATDAACASRICHVALSRLSSAALAWPCPSRPVTRLLASRRWCGTTRTSAASTASSSS